jgi:uncharacterized protein YdaU (DUF1376 family)
MAKEKAPHMPWYGRDFYGDENVLVMNLEQEGAYLRLLWNCWQEGSIPEDTAKLAAICKNVPIRRFEREIWPTLRGLFVAGGGRLVHRKVELIRAGKEAFQKKCSDAGKIGNERRWGKNRVPDSDPMQTRSEPELGSDHKSVAVNVNVDCQYKTDLDYAPTNHKNRDSSAPVDSADSPIRQYPRLREALHRYFQEPGQEDLRPADRLVADVMDAAGGASEADVIACLEYLREVRGLKPGTKHGPRHWSWFRTVVQDYFARKRERGENADPCGRTARADGNGTTADREAFDRMLEAIELPGTEEA